MVGHVLHRLRGTSTYKSDRIGVENFRSGTGEPKLIWSIVIVKGVVALDFSVEQLTKKIANK